MTTDPKSARPLKETQDYLAEVIAERDKLRAQLLGTGAQCSTCDFKYWEHKGHIIACPVCELSIWQEKARGNADAYNEAVQRAELAERELSDLRAELAAFERAACCPDEQACKWRPAPSAASGLALNPITNEPWEKWEIDSLIAHLRDPENAKWLSGWSPMQVKLMIAGLSALRSHQAPVGEEFFCKTEGKPCERWCGGNPCLKEGI
jgi:uncharacterized Zn finger protein (UPF0148 family)